MSDAIYNEGGTVPEEYNDLMMFWEKFSPKSYDEYIGLDFIIFSKIKEYLNAQAHGEKRLKNKTK